MTWLAVKLAHNGFALLDETFTSVVPDDPQIQLPSGGFRPGSSQYAPEILSAAPNAKKVEFKEPFSIHPPKDPAYGRLIPIRV